MAKNSMRLTGPDSTTVLWTNGTGVAKVTGDIVAYGRTYARLCADTAINGENNVDLVGVLDVPKLSTDVLTVGQMVVWSEASQRVTPAGNLGTGWQVVEAAGNGTTVVKVRMTGLPHVFAGWYTLSAGDDTANSVTIDTFLGATPGPSGSGAISVNVVSATGVHRKPQGTVTWGSGGAIGRFTVADTGFAVNEKIEYSVPVL